MSDGFSDEWDKTYRGAKHLSVWPWSDLVSWVMTHARPENGFSRVIEIGVGAGANIPFFLRLGVDYWAIEGSPAIVARLQEAFPDLRERIVAGDFTATLPGDGPVDLIVDRSSMTHNTTPAIRGGLKLAASRLRPGGKYLGIDWFSTEADEFKAGVAVDENTRRDIEKGRFVGVGNVHFSDFAHLQDLFGEAGFDIERCVHKVSDTALPQPARQAEWNFVAVKR